MSKTYKGAFLDGEAVTLTDPETNTVITVEHVSHNRCYVSYNDIVRVVPFMAAYQVVTEKSVKCIASRHFITEYTPTTV